MRYAALAALAAFALPAGAVQWWNSPDSTTNNVSPNQPSSGAWTAGACTSGGAAATASGCQQFNITATVDGTSYTMKVRAYSTPTVTGSNTSPAGNWMTANLYNYAGSGFGVSNRVAGDTNEGSQPEHAVDNDQVYDMIVFELPQVTGQTWDLEAFRLGWASEGGNGINADIQTWFGGGSLGANYDFTKVCFSGCTGTAKALTGGTGTLGFTDITTSLSSAGNPNATNLSGTVVGCAASTDGFDVCENANVSVGSSATGNYVVMSGRLGDVMDAFKPEMIQAKLIPGGPGGNTPVPGTAYLLGLGLVGAIALRRRPGKR